MENILCKVPRRMQNQNADMKQWVDTLSPTQVIFDFTCDGHVKVMHVNGTVQVLDHGSLLSRFPFGKSLLTPLEIAKEMNLITNGDNDVRSFRLTRLPEEIMRPACAIEFEFAFPYPSKPNRVGMSELGRAASLL